MTEKEKKTEKIENIKCLDQNGHLILKPIVDVAKSLDCPFIALIGEKRIGKTYGCIEYALKEFYKSGSPCFYVRRYDKTFTENICGNLVNSHRQSIINLSKGLHNTGILKGKYYDLSRQSESESGNIMQKARKHFAFCRSLNNIETETADDKGAVSCIIYDEFLTRGRELSDEFNKLMICHANATALDTSKYIPMFLLGNTVSKESDVAKSFGIKLRDLQRGLNIIKNTKGQTKIVVYYVPPSIKGSNAGNTYYDRFENDRITMISTGDWTIGTYRNATELERSLQGSTMIVSHETLCVKLTVSCYGLQPIVYVSEPTSNCDFRICSKPSKTSTNVLPVPIAKLIQNGHMCVQNSEVGENFRDICKYLINGQIVVNTFD